MNYFDIILLLIIAGFAFAGLRFGFIHTLGSLLGTVFSLYIATRYYEPVANWIIGFTGWGGNATRVVVFVLSFLLIARLVGVAFWLMEKFAHIVTFLPFLTSVNHALGFAFGALEGIVSVGVALYFIERFPLAAGFMQAVAESGVAAFASRIAGLLWPLVPDALRLLRSSVDYVEQVVR